MFIFHLVKWVVSDKNAKKKYRKSEDQSLNEQVFIPKADEIFFDPLNKLTNANRMKTEMLILCFFPMKWVFSNSNILSNYYN